MHIKFLALFFVALAFFAGISSAQDSFVDGGGSTNNNCQCFGRRRWTRFCCDGSEGFVQFDQCVQGRAGRFLRCCQSQGLRGTCTV